MKTALAAGITAMGETHAGAGEGTARVLREFIHKMRQAAAASGVFEAEGVRIADAKGLAAYIVNKITGAYGGEKGRIPGYGHRYYSLYGRDPRAVTLLEMAKELGLFGEHCQLAKEIEVYLQEKKAQGLCFNVDGVIGALTLRSEHSARGGKSGLHHPPHGGHPRSIAGTRSRLILPPLQRLDHLHRPPIPQLSLQGVMVSQVW